tara:strand:+ start:528 stop:782 length:255 start_codon:yes stop_codon:yes gene_type:complete
MSFARKRKRNKMKKLLTKELREHIREGFRKYRDGEIEEFSFTFASGETLTYPQDFVGRMNDLAVENMRNIMKSDPEEKGEEEDG